MNNSFAYLQSIIGIQNAFLISQLAEEKYQNINVDIFSRHKTKIAWVCPLSHIFYSSLYNKENGRGCPICNGKQILSGYNDLQSQHPNLAKEWHPHKNSNCIPSEITAYSSKKAWWVCDKGHEWEAVINSRTKQNRGCPYCKNQKVLAGFNDLEFLYPNIAKKWHPTLNNGITPNSITPRSNKKYWWKCDEGHDFTSSTINIIKGINCGVCKNMQTQIGVNSLLDTNPELELEYSPNNKKPFAEYRKNSKDKVLWVCKKGHEWKSSIYKRAILGRGCHECSGYLLSKGNNDFLSLASEDRIKSFNKEKNTVNIEELFISSKLKVWWKCDKGHEWKAAVYSRAAGNGCRKCSKQVSMAEQEITKFISNLGLETIQSDRKLIPPYELDIYVPEKNIAIEYNGLYWHSEEAGKDRNYHYNKWLACKEQGIQLIQIWEDDYKRNPELVKNMLAHKLGASTQQKIYARNTTVKTVSKTDSDEFLNDNHIQGSVDGKIRLGLYTENKLVAIMVLKTEAGSQGKTLNLLRFATSVNVVGGFTKLLSWVEKSNPQITSIVTFSDNTISDGGLYNNNGFIIAGIVKPDYMYITNGERNHKFNYRLKRFKSDASLLWEDGLTETQLAKLNSLTRIWDAGKTKWVKNL